MKTMKKTTEKNSTHIKHIFSLQRAIKSSESPSFIPKRADFARWVKIGLAELDHAVEVCFRVVNKTEIQALNNTYRKKDKPTNVLSFPSDIPDDIPQEISYLGDIVLCADIINEEALEQNKLMNEHWAHIVLHGLLHLLGYDHIHDEEAVTMETLEIQLLAKLGISNPYRENVHV